MAGRGDTGGQQASKFDRLLSSRGRLLLSLLTCASQDRREIGLGGNNASGRRVNEGRTSRVLGGLQCRAPSNCLVRAAMMMMMMMIQRSGCHASTTLLEARWPFPLPSGLANGPCPLSSGGGFGQSHTQQQQGGARARWLRACIDCHCGGEGRGHGQRREGRDRGAAMRARARCWLLRWLRTALSVCPCCSPGPVGETPE